MGGKLEQVCLDKSDPDKTDSHSFGRVFGNGYSFGDFGNVNTDP